MYSFPVISFKEYNPTRQIKDMILVLFHNSSVQGLIEGKITTIYTSSTKIMKITLDHDETKGGRWEGCITMHSLHFQTESTPYTKLFYWN